MPILLPTLLAIETSSELASCALLRGDVVLSRASSGVRTHSQSILPMVQELLAEAGVTLADVDAIAYGSGPGSFTGVRTACGIAQGLAYGASLPVVPVVTLDAMALACHQQHGAQRIVTVLDARMGEVYWAQYDYQDGLQAVSAAGPERAGRRGAARRRGRLRQRFWRLCRSLGRAAMRRHGRRGHHAARRASGRSWRASPLRPVSS